MKLKLLTMFLIAITLINFVRSKRLKREFEVGQEIEVTYRIYFLKRFCTFKVIEFLGEGSYGKVYKVERMESKYKLCQEIPNPVALKITKVFNQKDLEKAKSEEKVLRILKDSPFVPKLYMSDLFKLGSTFKPFVDGPPKVFYQVQELVDIDLFKFNISQKNAESFPKIRLSIVEMSFEALAFIHNKGILHNDIRLGNMMLNLKNEQVDLKLIDFGLGTIENSKEKIPTNSIFPYYAPEINNASMKKIDEVKPEKSMDIYAMGLAMLELFTDHNYNFMHNLEDRTNLIRKFYDSKQNLLGNENKIVDLLLTAVVEDPTKRPTADYLLDELKKIIHAQ